MNEILKIEIYIRNINYQKNLKLEKNILTTDNKTRNIDEKVYYNLFRIIRTWDNNLISNTSLDDEEYNIKIYKNNGIETIKGKGQYPKNYNEFKDWFGELYERTIF